MNISRETSKRFCLSSTNIPPSAYIPLDENLSAERQCGFRALSEKHHPSLVLFLEGISDYPLMGRRHYDHDKACKALGLRVRELRNQKGWTLEECEEHGWLNWRHLQAVESGKNVTFLTMVNLANLFNITLSELFRSV